MINLLLLILISSLISTGFYAACQFEGDSAYDASDKWVKKQWTKPTDKMLLWWVRFYGGRVIPQYWTKPIYSCLTCMGSIHSLWPMWVMGQDMTLWPIVAFGTVGVNYLIQTVLWK